MAASGRIDEANESIAAEAPALRWRQVLGLVLLAIVTGGAAVVFPLMFAAQPRPASAPEKLGAVAALVAGVFLIGRTMIFLGWRRIDGFHLDGVTGILRFHQRKLGGHTTRTVRLDELVEIREMVFSDAGGHLVACFDFRLRNSEKLRFHPLPVSFEEVKRRLAPTGLLRT
jgi:hypothetical protein